MKNLQNKVAVITGAGSGIGRALAQDLAKQGCRLALTDVREEGLAETRRLLDLPDQAVLCKLVDVSELGQMEDFAREVTDYFKRVDILINNAGIGSSGGFEEQTLDTMRKIIDINMWGVVYGCRVFLPLLRKQSGASLVNISSINGVVPFPENAPYNMSKYAVLGLNETLLMELKGSGVQLLSVHPGYIRTNIAEYGIGFDRQTQNAFRKVARTSPEQAARQIVKAIRAGKTHLFIGADAKAFQALKRISPNVALAVSDFVTRTLGPRL